MSTLSGIILITLLISPLFLMAQIPDFSPQIPERDLRITMPGPPVGAGWGFLYGYESIKAANYLPMLRKMNGGPTATKVYLIWNQIEPQKGQYDWSAVDKFADQLDSPEEGLIALFSSSSWATEKPSTMLPPSMPKNMDDYYRVVYDMVKHCKGCVRYWQNDSEPNNPIYWAGTKEQFVDELKVFYKAVKDADPNAVVVVGGYDGLFGLPGTHQFPGQQAGLEFFDYVFKEGRSAFDVFDLRLYGDPYTIVARVNFMREKMLTLGYDKPIICTEYGGPNLFEFAENRKYVALAGQWIQLLSDPNSSARKSGPQNPITQLYDKMSTLAPETQIFMKGCSPELEARYNRIQSRGMVMRNLFAFSAGIQKAMYWQFLADFPDRDDLMTLMYGKIGMVGTENGELKDRRPIADTYELMAHKLLGVREVKQIPIPDRPTIFLFKVERDKRKPLYVIWEQRDMFSGEDAPAVPFSYTWDSKKTVAEDAFGKAVPVEVKDKLLHLAVSLTPVYIESE